MAGARKRKGEGEIGRAEQVSRAPNFPLSLSLSSACHAGYLSPDTMELKVRSVDLPYHLRPPQSSRQMNRKMKKLGAVSVVAILGL